MIHRACAAAAGVESVFSVPLFYVNASNCVQFDS